MLDLSTIQLGLKPKLRWWIFESCHLEILIVMSKHIFIIALESTTNCMLKLYVHFSRILISLIHDQTASMCVPQSQHMKEKPTKNSFFHVMCWIDNKTLKCGISCILLVLSILFTVFNGTKLISSSCYTSAIINVNIE